MKQKPRKDPAMPPDQASRRSLLTGLASILGLSTFANKASAAIVTPCTTAGPYYPEPSMRRPDTDNDLVKIAGKLRRAGGEIITLRGQVFDTQGNPRTGHRIEIWQCDVDGNYMHPRDARSANFDPAFQGFGHDITDSTGTYVFRTIKPTIYPGRTPHIHVRIFDGSREILTTQFYIKDHPDNANDGLFRRMSKAQADVVSMTFETGADGLETTLNQVV